MTTCASALATLFLLSSSPAFGQEPLHDSLLERMAGTWVLQGTIGGAPTTHDVDVEWVLAHQYLRLREVSREKDANGSPAYEAIVFVGWDAKSARYACLWLDNTGGGGLNGQAIGYAPKDADRLAFVFRPPGSEPFHTTFLYDPKADAWEWRMDGEEGGKLQPFARVKLARK